MTLSRRIAVAFVAAALVGIPIVVGVVRAEAPLLAVGQEPSTPVFFEAASVRANTSGDLAAYINDLPGGRLVATNATLRTLILQAYQMLDNQLVDAPDWARTERFDVNAKLEREPSTVPRGEPGERQLALRSLLAERFKLLIHRETREFPMYALVMARSDRRLGPMLKPSSTDCSPETVQARVTAASAGNLGPGSGLCGTRVTTGHIQFGGRSLGEFARSLSRSTEVGRSVIDRTELTGNWDLDLTFTPDRLPQLSPGREPPAIDPNAPSLFVALQEQLGIRLESIRGPMEVLVVDRLQRLDPRDAN